MIHYAIKQYILRFESEINSLVADGGGDAQEENEEKPTPAALAAPPMSFMPRGVALPPPGGMLGAPLGMMRGPLPPPPLPGIFMPPQLRGPGMPPMMVPPVLMSSGGGASTSSATISSKPEIYKDPKEEKCELPLTADKMKTMVLPADVELNELRKAKARNFQNSYIGAVQRGEKKMKRFVRSAGGQVWEDQSLAEWDPADFRIFCGDLGNEVSDELLAKAFRKYPSFQKAKVVRDSRSNKSKGYGFVSFKSQEDFVRACREMDGKYVGNRPVKLRKSNWKDRSMEVVKKKQKQKQKLGLI